MFVAYGSEVTEYFLKLLGIIKICTLIVKNPIQLPQPHLNTTVFNYLMLSNNF